MRVLLTGANGFVGSHIAERLIAGGHRVACMVRSSSNLQWLNGLDAEYRLCDVTGIHASPETLKDIDVVIHSAGVLRALTPETYYEVNQKATRDLAEAVLAINPGIKKFVHISSQAAMGPGSGHSPKRLTEPENPVSDYGKSKLSGERELKVLDGKVPYTILRPASVYGPRDRDIFIFFHLAHRGFCPRPLQERFIQLLFVKDLAEAVLKAMDNPATDYKTYFLAEDHPYSWREIGETIAASIGRKTLPIPLPDAAFYLTSSLAEGMARLRNKPAVLNRQKVDEMMQHFWLGDTSGAEKDLDMDFTKLKIGAKITYLWYKENHWL